jgi:hypothetical protein
MHNAAAITAHASPWRVTDMGFFRSLFNGWNDARTEDFISETDKRFQMDPARRDDFRPIGVVFDQAGRGGEFLAAADMLCRKNARPALFAWTCVIALLTGKDIIDIFISFGADDCAAATNAAMALEDFYQLEKARASFTHED